MAAVNNVRIVGVRISMAITSMVIASSIVIVVGRVVWNRLRNYN